MRLTPQKIVARYAASRPKLFLYKSADQIAVNLGTDTEVGYLLLGPVSSVKSKCESLVEEIQREVFGSKPVPLWHVTDVQLDPEFRGKGWGLKMYEKALRAARPAIIVSGDCIGYGTTVVSDPIMPGFCSLLCFTAWRQSLKNTHKELCPAESKITDEYGRKARTLTCHLPRGHKGRHAVEMSWYEKENVMRSHDIVITWAGDDLQEVDNTGEPLPKDKDLWDHLSEA